MINHFGIFQNAYITTLVFTYLAYNQRDNQLN